MYIVYHIPGIKFGCTNDIKRRSKDNRRKYGKDITIDIVDIFEDIDEADEFEEFCNNEAGYKGQKKSYKSSLSMAEQAIKSPNHLGNSKETRKKISGMNNHFYGETHTTKSLKMMSDAAIGRIPSETTRKKISFANSGEKNGMFGETRSPTVKKKLSDAMLSSKHGTRGKKIMNDGIKNFVVDPSDISTFLTCGCSLGRNNDLKN